MIDLIILAVIALAYAAALAFEFKRSRKKDDGLITNWRLKK